MIHSKYKANLLLLSVGMDFPSCELTSASYTVFTSVSIQHDFINKVFVEYTVLYFIFTHIIMEMCIKEA